MSEFNMKLPRDVLFILERMNESGYSAHVVGGSVRDSLIGRPLSDFDITTNATPDETKAVFEGYKTIDTGIKHGTVTLVLDGTPYEITTYRVDGDYKDNRHPDSVTFTDRLEEDLARRDFTVNAMAYDPTLGLSDPFGGREDAERKLIRAVGDPRVRFDEDALRILRALRFASVLGFRIEDATATAARELAPRLTSISKERVYTELKKLIMGVDSRKILVEYSAIFEIILGGLVIEKMPQKALFDEADYYSRLASIFLLNTSEPAAYAERILTELKTDKFTRTHTSSVLSAYESASFDSRKSALTTLAKCGKEVTEGVLALGILTGRFSDNESTIFTDALECGVPYTIGGLNIRGTDLIALGIKGEKIGEALGSLLTAVIDGKVENEKGFLLSFIKAEYGFTYEIKKVEK